MSEGTTFTVDRERLIACRGGGYHLVAGLNRASVRFCVGAMTKQPWLGLRLACDDAP